MPSQITRPRLWPRIVSMTASQSDPAVNPGPRPTTSGAASRVVSMLRLANLASTRTAAARPDLGNCGENQHGDLAATSDPQGLRRQVGAPPGDTIDGHLTLINSRCE